MNRCYVGVGGIGCRTLKEYENTGAKGRFIYIDAVPADLEHLESGECYALTKQKNGCTQRIIGKDEIRVVIYNGLMPNFIDEFFLGDNLEVVFVTSTFGGFGSATVSDISDYYSLKIKSHRQLHKVDSEIKCRVVAFPLQSIDYLHCAPKTLLDLFSTNEIEFINDFRSKEPRNNKWYREHSNCFPFVELFVPLPPEGKKLSDIVGFSHDVLNDIDIKQEYYVKSCFTQSAPEVFISYSSKNQVIADMLVRNAKDNGISCWIASACIEAGSYAKQIVQGIKRSKIFVVIVSADSIASPHIKNELDIATSRIKEGLIIMPFKIDAADLDDECRYYLGRQEFFMGEKPPIEEKIEQFVNSIKKVLNK